MPPARQVAAGITTNPIVDEDDGKEYPLPLNERAPTPHHPSSLIRLPFPNPKQGEKLARKTANP